MLYNLMAVFIGGGLGSVVRFGMSILTVNNSRSVFPFATLLSNIFSCLALGLAVYFLEEKMTNDISMKLLIIIGFCGGFSTFSAFSYETVQLIKSGNIIYAILNVLISVAVCFGVIFFLTRNIKH